MDYESITIHCEVCDDAKNINFIQIEDGETKWGRCPTCDAIYEGCWVVGIDKTDTEFEYGLVSEDDDIFSRGT